MPEHPSPRGPRMAARVGVPAFCVLALIGVGVALAAILPVKVEERSCGSALSVVTGDEAGTAFSEECHHKAPKELAFGGALIGLGVVCAAASLVGLRRPEGGGGAETAADPDAAPESQAGQPGTAGASPS